MQAPIKCGIDSQRKIQKKSDPGVKSKILIQNGQKCCKSATELNWTLDCTWGQSFCQKTQISWGGWLDLYIFCEKQPRPIS